MSNECVGCGVKGTAVRLREVKSPNGHTYTALVCGSCRDTSERPPVVREERKMRLSTEIEDERAKAHRCLECGTQLYKKEPNRPGRYPLRCSGCKAAA